MEKMFFKVFNLQQEHRGRSPGTCFELKSGQNAPGFFVGALFITEYGKRNEIFMKLEIAVFSWPRSCIVYEILTAVIRVVLIPKKIAIMNCGSAWCPISIKLSNRKL